MGVIWVWPADERVVAWWREAYGDLVAKAGGGGPTAMAVTVRWARAEVEYAEQHHTAPRKGAR